LTLGDPVVQHQAVVEPLPVRRVKQKGLALADPGGQAINGFAFAEHFFDHHA
jgi:hypothetical protein